MEPRPPRLQGKVAIVTGAGSSGPGIGVGKAAAILFAREGARVILGDVVRQRAEETLALIQEEGGQATVVEANVTKAQDCRRLTDAAIEHYGGLHILFNNVGILGPGSVVDVKEEEWDRVMAVNLKGVMLASKYAIPKMKQGGCIINISSIGGVRGGGGIVSYAASKGGVIALTIAMAAHHGRDHIRVNCIIPGTIETPMVADEIRTPDQVEQRRRSVPLGTQGTAWDIAWAAVFLASDEARWITGAALPVDGGMLSSSRPA